MGERSEVMGLRKDGSEIPAEASISKLEVNGEWIFTAVIRDATERKQNERAILQLNQTLEERVRERTAALHDMTQQLWQAAKLASVGEVAAGVAHELNNPLATVVLRIESVLSKTPTNDPRRKSLRLSNRN